MKYSLKNHYHYLLKEEIDYSSKIATVYHLTGSKTEMYDPNWAKLKNKTTEEYESEIDDKYSNRKPSRASNILKSLEKSSAYKAAEKYKGKKGKAYYIAKKIQGSLFDLGSYFDAGGGDSYGKGLYTCYRLNPSIARGYGPVILRFDVDISNFLIFNAGVAQKIYGENFRLEDQFKQILKNKGLDNTLSNDSSDALNNFFELLQSHSKKNQFLNSDYDIDHTTSGLAASALNNFSENFGNGHALKLRDIIDGIIFFGGSDGPVCVVYHPERAKTYKLTGAGYFDEDNNAIIEDDIESLADKKSYSLKDSFRDALETDSEIALEISRENENRVKEVLANYDSRLFNIDEHIEKIKEPLYIALEGILKNTLQDVIIERYNNTPETDLYFDNMSKAYNFVQLSISILAEPFIEFTETFGQDLNTLSREEFESYCHLLNSYYKNKNPSLLDFSSSGIVCKAKSEEEFSILVNSNLNKILDKLKRISDENLELDIENISYALSDFSDCDVSNSFTSFNIFDIQLKTFGDKNIIRQYFKSDSKIQNALISLKEYIDNIDNNMMKNSLKNILTELNITSEEGDVIIFDNYIGHWSDIHSMPPEFIYAFTSSYFNAKLESQIGNKLSQYEIDKNICNPFFILSLYGVESTYAIEHEYCSEIKKMYREGSKVMSIGTGVTPDFLKSFFLTEKADNLEGCLEFEGEGLIDDISDTNRI